MFITGFPAAAFGTNCYVLAAEVGQECVVVDPGIGVLPRLAEVLAEHRLRPAAVLLTHGHLDHVYSVTPVCRSQGIPALVHADDRHRLVDPIAALDPGLLAMLEQQFGARASWDEPEHVETLHDDQVLDAVGLQLRVIHAPGHTEGSVMFAVAGTDGANSTAGAKGTVAGIDGATLTVFSGDVLFAGSIGRCDLSGGDPVAMQRSLRDKVLTLPDHTRVLPGHGPQTTMARERIGNPYLLELIRAGVTPG